MFEITGESITFQNIVYVNSMPEKQRKHQTSIQKPSLTQIQFTQSPHVMQRHCGKVILGAAVLRVVDDLDMVETVGFLNSNFPLHSTKKLLELINKFSKVAKSIHRNQLHFSTLIMNHQKEKESNPIYNCIKKNKIPGNKVNQGGERPAH